MKNKAIIFDMGGVLIDLDLEACKEAFKKNLGFQRIDDIIDACHQKGIWGEMEEGKITADQFRQTILAGSFENAVPQDVDDAVGAILVGIMEYKVALLKRLAEDYDIYMLSNNNPIATAHARRINNILLTNVLIFTSLDRYFYILHYQVHILKVSTACQG